MATTWQGWAVNEGFRMNSDEMSVATGNNTPLMAMRGFVLCIRDEVRRRSRAQSHDPSRLWAEKRGRRRGRGLNAFLSRSGFS